MLSQAFYIRELTVLDAGSAHQFEFIWVRRGKARLTVDLEEYILSTNSICVVGPGQWRSLAGTGNLGGYHFGVSSDFFPTLTEEMNHYFVAPLKRKNTRTVLVTGMDWSHQLIEVILLIKNEYDRNGLSRMDVITGLLHIFLLYLSKNAQAENQAEKWNGPTEKAMLYLEMVAKNFLEKKKVSDYARDLALTPAHLNYIVKKASGFTAKYHIHQRILAEAKRLILAEDPGIKELAYSLGFYDCAHFSKYFKQACGMTFSSFRQRYLKT